MSGRQCSATDKALQLWTGGLSVRKAAAQAGVAPSTVQRAIDRQRQQSQSKPA